MAGSSSRQINLEELAKHNTEKDAWMAVNGKVYDVTAFISKHPGGKAAIMPGVGKDATEMYMQAHAYVNADKVNHVKQIGVLKR